MLINRTVKKEILKYVKNFFVEYVEIPKKTTVKNSKVIKPKLLPETPNSN